MHSDILNIHLNDNKMKAKILFVLAAVAMLFTACQKEKINDNEIIYNGITYHLQNVDFVYFDSAHGQIRGNSVEIGPGGTPEVVLSDLRVRRHSFGKSYDLAEPEDYEIEISISGEAVRFILRHELIWVGWIGETYYATSIFSHGTLTITNDSNGLVYALNGTLRNGDTVQIRIALPEVWVEP